MTNQKPPAKPPDVTGTAPKDNKREQDVTGTAKPPRVWTFVGTYTQESGGEYWIVDGPRPTEKNKFDLVERSYASRLEQELADVRKERDELLTAMAVVKQKFKADCELNEDTANLWLKVLNENTFLHQERDQALAQAAALAGALEGLTNAALAGLKPLPSQIELGFDALAEYREWLKGRE